MAWTEVVKKQAGAALAVLRETKSLSPRECEVLGMLLTGKSEKQIAYRLRLSTHTVHVYMKALYRRFGVSARGELMTAVFFEHVLKSPPGQQIEG